MRQRRFDRFFTDPGGIFLRWFSALEKRFLPPYVWESDMLTFWRERILFVTCLIAAVLGPIALIPSVILSYVEGRWNVIILDMFVYSMAVVILLGRGIPLTIRVWSVCLALYLLGVGLLFMLGSVGAGYIWLFGASVMAGALIGLRASFFALMMNFVALSAVALFIAFGQPQWIVDPTNAVERWLVMSLNFILLNTFVTLTTAMMLSGLQRALSKELEMSKSLRQSEERFRTAFRTSPDSIAVSRLSDGRYVDINDGFTTMLGYGRDAVIGCTIADLKIWDDPEDRETLVRELKAKGIVNNMEVLLIAKGGIVKTGLMSASLFEYHGAPHVLSVTRDVTALKVAERQLQQARKMEAIGILAGGIAHDFNNILQVINGYTQLLMLEKSETDPDHAKLGDIEKAVEHAAQLVRQLLTFSRKVESRTVALNLNKEIISVRKILERTMPKMININLHLGRELAPVTADPVQIEQVLLNLGTNAADAMPDGGILVIETENVTLTDDYLDNHISVRAGEYILLSVSDTGQGMDKDIVEHIFEPFFTTKEFGKGTGLGLASVYGIVKSYGGYISCHSEAGRGTTFKLYLPIAESQASPEEKNADGDLPRGGTETVLLVDDDESIRTFASAVLRRFGYRVLTGASGEEALEVIGRTEGEIALVILDLGMPGMGGHKCLQEIRKTNPPAKVLIASGYSMNGELKKSLSTGAAGYIGKPYRINVLLRKVREILDEER
jgi:two-component system cell cycle sensor histidine kinase/response regulator CckA